MDVILASASPRRKKLLSMIYEEFRVQPSDIRELVPRDLEVEKQIRAEDWIVIRFWGNDIKHNLDACIAVVKETIQERIFSDYTDLIEY